jgi:hypothetical protein
MADGVRRARKRRLANVVFVVASAHDLPPDLEDTADAVRIHFPWGSLLEAIVRGDEAVARSLARIMKPGAELTIMTSVVDRDGVPGLDSLDGESAREVGARLAGAAEGALVLVESRLVTPADVAESHSTWAKRLGVGRTRPAWLLRLRR